MSSETCGLILWVLGSLLICLIGFRQLGLNNMSRFVEHLRLPLRSITTKPYQFTVWLFVTVFFGLAGFWLPLVLVAVNQESISPVLTSLVRSGALASFCVVILAEGIAGVLVTVGGGGNDAAAGLRALAGGFGIMFVLVGVGLLVRGQLTPGQGHQSSLFHYAFTTVSIVIACYLYCFRNTEWEPSADTFTANDEQEAARLGNSALAQSQDDSGTKL